MQTQWRLGTIGFGYDDWVGPFYPPRTRSIDFLAEYARHFSAVELDTTFHAAPPKDRVQKWAQAVPDDFRIAVKTPRAITHEPPLSKTLWAMLDFIDIMRELGDKLGVILVQFPPAFPFAAIHALRSFLDDLPSGVRYAVELRHPSWFAGAALDQTRQMLADRAMAWVSIDHDGSPARVIPTTDFMYARFIGKHERFKYLGEEQIDVLPQMNWWKSQIEPHVQEPAMKTVWMLYGNDFAGYGVGSLRRMAKLMNVPLPEPVKPTGEAGLFDLL